MTESFYKLTRFIGLDKAILYQGSGVIIGSIGGFITLILITLRFSPDEQGVYYTFTSIAALQVFFELGLTGIIVQFAAHEFAHLKTTPEWELTGSQKYISRLSSLLRLFVKWYFITAVLMIFQLLVTGFLFFTKYNKNQEIHWQIPWVVLCFGTAAFFVQNMFLAFLEGCGQIKETSKIRTLAQLCGLAVSIPCLYSKYGLYALGVTALTRVIISILMIHKNKFHLFFQNIWKQEQSEQLSYWKEIFPFQWKIALSWLSGYFIFNLFNPVLFAFVGAQAAGQMGLTITVLGLATSLGNCWINTKIPLFSMLIAQKNYLALDNIFNRTLKQMLILAAASLISFIVFLKLLSCFHISFNGILLAERFLPFIPLLFMTISVFSNLFISAFAVYLRCHKKEPYMWLSVITGILCAVSAVLITQYYGMSAMTFSYCLITVTTNIFGYKIFKEKKKEWHHA